MRKPPLPDDWKGREPTLLEIWRKANVYERAAWVLAAIGSALLAWLVVKKIP